MSWYKDTLFYKNHKDVSLREKELSNPIVDSKSNEYGNKAFEIVNNMKLNDMKEFAYNYQKQKDFNNATVQELVASGKYNPSDFEGARGYMAYDPANISKMDQDIKNAKNIRASRSAQAAAASLSAKASMMNAVTHRRQIDEMLRKKEVLKENAAKHGYTISTGQEATLGTRVAKQAENELAGIHSSLNGVLGNEAGNFYRIAQEFIEKNAANGRTISPVTAYQYALSKMNLQGSDKADIQSVLTTLNSQQAKYKNLSNIVEQNKAKGLYEGYNVIVLNDASILPESQRPAYEKYLRGEMEQGSPEYRAMVSTLATLTAPYRNVVGDDVFASTFNRISAGNYGSSTPTPGNPANVASNIARVGGGAVVAQNLQQGQGANGGNRYTVSSAGAGGGLGAFNAMDNDQLTQFVIAAKGDPEQGLNSVSIAEVANNPELVKMVAGNDKYLAKRLQRTFKQINKSQKYRKAGEEPVTLGSVIDKAKGVMESLNLPSFDEALDMTVKMYSDNNGITSTFKDTGTAGKILGTAGDFFGVGTKMHEIINGDDYNAKVEAKGILLATERLFGVPMQELIDLADDSNALVENNKLVGNGKLLSTMKSWANADPSTLTNPEDKLKAKVAKAYVGLLTGYTVKDSALKAAEVALNFVPGGGKVAGSALKWGAKAMRATGKSNSLFAKAAQLPGRILGFDPKKAGSWTYAAGKTLEKPFDMFKKAATGASTKRKVYGTKKFRDSVTPDVDGAYADAKRLTEAEGNKLKGRGKLPKDGGEETINTLKEKYLKKEERRLAVARKNLMAKGLTTEEADIVINNVIDKTLKKAVTLGNNSSGRGNYHELLDNALDKISNPKNRDILRKEVKEGLDAITVKKAVKGKLSKGKLGLMLGAYHAGAAALTNAIDPTDVKDTNLFKPTEAKQIVREEKTLKNAKKFDNSAAMGQSVPDLIIKEAIRTKTVKQSQSEEVKNIVRMEFSKRWKKNPPTTVKGAVNLAVSIATKNGITDAETIKAIAEAVKKVYKSKGKTEDAKKITGK